MARNLFQYHPVFGYTFIPGLKARIEHEGGGYLVQVNQAGFRSHREFQAAKPPGVYRILVFGDSFTAGDGVSNRDRYTDILESLLPNTEVYNFGLSGTGTDQQYQIWREFAPAIEYDLAVMAVQYDNIRRCAAQFRLLIDGEGRMFVQAKPYFALECSGQLNLHHVPPPKEMVKPDEVPLELRSLVDWSGMQGRHAGLRKFISRLGPRAKDFIQWLTRFQPCPDYNRPDNPAWQLQKAILQHWASELKTPGIIFPIPPYQYIEGSSSARQFQARFTELNSLPNCRLQDPLAELRSYPLNQRRGFRYADDPHTTPSGHRALAQSLAKAIKPLMENTGAAHLEPINSN
jgi:carbamoyltransferase